MIWSYTYNPHIWPALVTIALMTFLSTYSWRRRNVPGARPFAFGSLFAVFWAIGTVLEISAVDFSTAVFWIKFQVAWQLPAATALFCFIMEYAGLGRWLNRRNLILLSIPSVLLMALIITNSYHSLMWTGFRMEAYIYPLPGKLNPIFLGYAYLLAVINFIVLLWLAVRFPRFRWPVAVMLVGQIIGRGVFLLNYVFPGFLGSGETILFVLGFLSSMYAVALFRFHVFDPVPLARSTVIQQMGDGMLVTDLQGKIVDLNPAAARIFGMSPGSLKEKNLSQLVPMSSNLLDLSSKSEGAVSEITLGNDKSARYYSLNLTLLNDRRGHALGHLLLLRDITDQKRAQEQIMEHRQLLGTLQERERLARELHDSIGQTLGYVNIQTQAIRKLMREGKNSEAETEFSRLLEVVRDSHKDVRESILSLKTGVEGEWSFLTALKQYLIDFESHHGIRTELIIPEGITENMFEAGPGAQILRVIQEALTNARKHSQAQNIKVTIDRQDGQSRIIVSDDGVGFEAGAKLDSYHFGLNFMRERMQQIGGLVTIDSQPGAGTVVNITAPIS